jgi:hypothetical protein
MIDLQEAERLAGEQGLTVRDVIRCGGAEQEVGELGKMFAQMYSETLTNWAREGMFDRSILDDLSNEYLANALKGKRVAIYAGQRVDREDRRCYMLWDCDDDPLVAIYKERMA